MNDYRQRSNAIREAQRTARRVVVDGEPWLVYELPALPFDRRTSASLVFENETAIRRVRSYPENWRDLTDADLLALSWST